MSFLSFFFFLFSFLGDEVIEWNRRSLQQKSYEDVYKIIAESKQEPQVEMTVKRKIQPEKGLARPAYSRRRGNEGTMIFF